MYYMKWTFQHALLDPLFTDKADVVLSSDLLSNGVDSLIRDSLMQQMLWAKRTSNGSSFLLGFMLLQKVMGLWAAFIQSTLFHSFFSS